MSELRFFGSVGFTAEAGLNPSGPHDPVLRIEGRVSGGLGEDASFVAEEAEDVGLVEAYLVQTARLDAEGIALGDVCDAYSDQLEEVYAALFDEEDEPRQELAIRGHWEGLLHVSWLELDARFRGSGVVGLTLETLVRHFCPGGVVTAYSSVLDLAAEEWGQLGFRRIAGSEVVYRDNTAADPYGHPLDEEERGPVGTLAPATDSACS